MAPFEGEDCKGTSKEKTWEEISKTNNKREILFITMEI